MHSQSWWLVLGWLTTKEAHPRLRIAYTSFMWRVVKFYLYAYNYVQLPAVWQPGSKNLAGMQAVDCVDNNSIRCEYAEIRWLVSE